MKVIVLLVGVLLFAGFSPVKSQGEELIHVKARMIRVTGQLGKSLSQEQLAAMVAAAVEKGGEVKMGASATLSDGTWMSAKKVRKFWYPTKYSNASLLKAKTDKRSYSIDISNVFDGENTQVIPRQVTKLGSKEVGIVLKLKPTLRGSGKITVEGTISEDALIELIADDSEPISFTTTKGRKTSRPKEVSANVTWTPVFGHVERKFSAEMNGPDKRFYVAMMMYKDRFENGTDLLPKSFTGEKVPVVIEVRANQLAPVSVNSAQHNKAKQIYITTRFFETDEPFESSQVLNNREFHLLVRKMSQKKGADLLSAPSIKLRSAQSGKVEILRQFLFPSSYDPPKADESPGKEGKRIVPVIPSSPNKFEQYNTGVYMEVTPRILSGGLIKLDTKSLLDEFEGFVNYGNPVMTSLRGGFGKSNFVTNSENKIKAPVFLTYSTAGSVVIPDGSTIVLSRQIRTVTLDIEEKEGLFKKRKSRNIQTPRYLTIFLTAQMMDESGRSIKEE